MLTKKRSSDCNPLLSASGYCLPNLWTIKWSSGYKPVRLCSLKLCRPACSIVQPAQCTWSWCRNNTPDSVIVRLIVQNSLAPYRLLCTFMIENFSCTRVWFLGPVCCTSFKSNLVWPKEQHYWQKQTWVGVQLERNFASKLQVNPVLYPNLIWQNAYLSAWSLALSAK